MGGRPPRAGGFAHLRRWYRHIASFEGEFADLPAADLNAFVLDERAEPDAANGAADEDIDLFGSEEEDDAEVISAREQRLREYQERAAGRSKPAAKTAITLDIKPLGKVEWP